MKKIFFRFFITIFIILFCGILYLSTIGISTKVFNSNISDQIKKIDKNLNIDLNKIFLILDPFQLKIKLKTVGTNLKYYEEKIQLENIRSEISLNSLLNKEFSINKMNISTKSIEINSLVKFLRLVQKDPKFYIAENIIKKGYLIADIEVEFDDNGNLKDNYKINGIVKDGKIDLFKRNRLDAINFIFEAKKDKIQLNDLYLKIEKENLQLPEIIIVKNNDEYSVSGKLISGQINLMEDRIYDYINLENINFKIKEIKFLSENNFNFSINEKFKIKGLNIDSKINLINLEIENNLDLKNYFPEINENFYFKDNQLQITYKKNTIKILGSGNMFLQERPDKIEYKIIKNKENLNFNTKLNIKDNNFKIDLLNFEKKNNSKLQIEIQGEHKIDKGIILKRINLEENKNSFLIKDLSLSNDNKINYIKNITLSYLDKDNLENKIQISKKATNYFINGSSLNINRIINNLLNSKVKKKYKLFKNDFKVKVDIEKIFLDKKNVLQNLNGYLILKDNKVFETELSSNYSNNNKIKFTIKTNGKEKITTLFSKEAKPLVDRYKFVKGFSEGSLDFYSYQKYNQSNSTLKIYDFKLKELPALTKLLTLASLQGIADLMSGEGIRFNEFEMNFSNQDQLMTINEIYAIGPAISVLMSGYVEKDKLISLRGTLVPATTLNKTIGSIPFLGNILVGKKTGEGVFGVSFKIKGPPKDLETTVNPIKTLTPRFITRTLEKIKNN